MKTFKNITLITVALLFWNCPKAQTPLPDTNQDPCLNAKLPSASFDLLQSVSHPDPNQNSNFENIKFIDKFFKVQFMKLNCEYICSTNEMDAIYNWKAKDLPLFTPFNAPYSGYFSPTIFDNGNTFKVELTITKTPNSKCFPNATNTFTSAVNYPVTVTIEHLMQDKTFTGAFLDEPNTPISISILDGCTNGNYRMHFNDSKKIDYNCNNLGYKIKYAADSVFYKDTYEYNDRENCSPLTCNQGNQQIEIKSFVGIKESQNITIYFLLYKNNQYYRRTFKGKKL